MTRRASFGWVRWVVLGLIPVVVIGGGLIAFFLITAQKPTDQATDAPGKTLTTERRQAVATKVQAVAAASGTDEGLRVVDDELEKTEDAGDKAYLYSMKIALESARSTPDLQKMTEYAREAEAQAPTYATALELADLYRQQDNKTEAVNYYKIYLERAAAVDMLNEDEKAQYTAIIGELST